MDARNELDIKSRAYQEAVELYVWDAYELDHPGVDVTTRAFLGSARQTVRAKITAKEDGILAGIQEAEWFLKELKIKVLKAKKDGAKIKKGAVVLEFSGRAGTVLSAERTLLNLLQRMSGVATKTKKLSMKLPKGMKLLATRKTLWGPLDKRAVTVGGGGTHRLDLSDAILIKENHIALAGSLKKGLKRSFKRSSKVRFVEIELETIKEVNEFLKLYEDLKRHLREGDGVVVMLDNFSPKDVKKVIKKLKDAGIFVELSGGINERNISRYNITGVSAISSGSITTQVGNLDMSMRITADK